MTEVEFRSDIRVELIDAMGGDHRAVQAARVSTKGANSLGEQVGGEGLINYLMRDTHTVPFEHSVFTFYIEAPIFVTRQILKHRMSSISEESGRYKILDAVFYVPSDARPFVQVGKTGDYVFESGSPGLISYARTTIKNASEDSWYRYTALLESGVAKEIARMVLPLNMYSSMYITVNAHSLMNILKLRTSHTGSHPQYEVEQVGSQMESIWADHSPSTYAAFQKHIRGLDDSTV